MTFVSRVERSEKKWKNAYTRLPLDLISDRLALKTRLPQCILCLMAMKSPGGFSSTGAWLSLGAGSFSLDLPCLAVSSVTAFNGDNGILHRLYGFCNKRSQIAPYDGCRSGFSREIKNRYTPIRG